MSTTEPTPHRPTTGDSRDGERYRWLKANPELLGLVPNSMLFFDGFIDAEMAKAKGSST